MFDGIGKTQDPEARRRGALATLIASLLVGGGAAFIVAAGAYSVQRTLNEPVEDDTPMAFLDLEEEPPPEAPPPPLAPPRRGGGKQAQQGTPDAAPDPSPVTDPVELKPLEPNKPLVDSEVRGEIDGTGTDEETIDAPPGAGDPDGVDGGIIKGRPMAVVHRSEVTLRTKIQPEFPNDVTEPQACRVSIDIGEKGRPSAIRITECDAPYAREARRALERWRWARGDAGKRTTYRIVFKTR